MVAMQNMDDREEATELVRDGEDPDAPCPAGLDVSIWNALRALMKVERVETQKMMSSCWVEELAPI